VSAAAVPGTASSEPADFGQHAAEPRLTVGFPSPGLRAARRGSDGVAHLSVHLRPIAGFAAPVRLSLSGLPEGVTSDLPADPLRLDGPRTLEIAFRGVAEDTARCTLLAEAGEDVIDLSFDLDLTTAGLEIEERTVAIAPGQTKVVRAGLATVSGRGRGALVKLTGLPPGVTVRVLRIRAMPAAPELEVEALTPEKLALHRAASRTGLGFPEAGDGKSPERRSPREVLTAAPDVLGRSSFFLAPGGHVEVAITASEDAATGEHEIELILRRGAVVTRERVTLRIER
jgi:hypothetical protein